LLIASNLSAQTDAKTKVRSKKEKLRRKQNVLMFGTANPLLGGFVVRAREPNVSDCTNCRCVIDAV